MKLANDPLPLRSQRQNYEIVIDALGEELCIAVGTANTQREELGAQRDREVERREEETRHCRYSRRHSERGAQRSKRWR